MGASQNDVEDALRSATDAVQDPDIVPAGATQATTTEEAKAEARKLLGRVGSHDVEAKNLQSDIENNAEASRAALRRAQQLLLQHPEVMFPSEGEIANRQAATLMTPNPNAGMAGAPYAQFGRLYAEEAGEKASQRQALQAYLEMASGLPLQEQLSKINEMTAASRQKLLEMLYKSDTELGRSAMSTLGRMSVAPGAQTAIKPNSTYGKIALDQLGPAAYNNQKDPTAGFSDAYRALVKQLNDAAVAEAKSRAGIDATAVTANQALAGAQAAGVPANPTGLPDTSKMATKQRQQFYDAEEKNAEKQMGAYGAEDEQIRAALRALDQFQELNKNTYTGPDLAPTRLGGAHVGPHGVGADLGEEGGINLNPRSIIAGFKPSIQTMNKLASQVVSMAIPAHGFGRVTNRDLNLFQSGSIGTDKSKTTNDAISDALRIRLNNDLERHNFFQSYFGQHRSLQGSEQSWDSYLKDNPIYDPNAKAPGPTGAYPLNPNRSPWQDYFRSRNVASAPGASGTTTQITKEPIEHAEGGEVQAPPPVRGSSSPGSPGVSGAIRDAIAALAKTVGPRSVAEIQPRENMREAQNLAGGGQPSDIQDALHALSQGLTFKAAGAPENPENPGINFAGETLGSGLSGLALLAALRSPRAVGRFMLNHPNLTAAGAGAVAGGVSGEMGSDDPFTGAVTGALAGPLARFGARGIFRLGEDALDRLRGQLITPGARKSINSILTDTGGDISKVGDILNQDARLKVPTTVAEAAGPRSVGLTTAALRKDVPDTNELLSELQGRQAGAGERVFDQVNQAMAPDNYLAKTEELRSGLYTKAQPLYEQAFSQFPSIQSPTLQKIMSTPSGGEAASRAFRMMQDQQLPVGSADAVGMVRNPSLQYLDQVKRALDDMIIQEEGVGPNYQATQQGRVLRTMRSQLVDELDKSTMGQNGQSPYRAARDQYAGDLDVLDSLRAGRETFPKLTPDEVRQLMTRLDYSSRDAFRSGVAEGIFQQIQGMGPNRNAAQAVISNPRLQEKLAAIFDDPKQAAKFSQALQRESSIFETGKPMIGAGEKGLAQSLAPTSISQMLRTQLMSKGTAGEIADTMGTNALDPEAKAKMARLRDIADRLKSRSATSNLVGTAGAAGAASALTPSQMQGQP